MRAGSFAGTALALTLVALAAPAGDLGSADDALTASEIYRRVLENRFDTSAQELVVRSGDRAGREQTLRMQMLWRSYGENGRGGEDGVQSRTVIRYLEPADMRRTGYLIVNKLDQPTDQFVYLSSMRRIRRINLRGETVVGTDLGLEDVVPREMDDASYRRIPDADVDGTSCLVVEAVPEPEIESEYSRFWLYVERAHYVPLRIRYWDEAGVEIKELRAPADSIREFAGVWIASKSTMRHLLDETYTTLTVTMLIPNPDLDERYFSFRQLMSKRLQLPEHVMARAQQPQERPP